MSYRDSSTGYKGVTYGAGAMITLGLGFVLHTCSTVASMGPPATPAAVEEQMVSDPRTGLLFRTIKRTYPDEFDAIRDDVASRAKAGATESELKLLVRDDLMQAAQRHQQDILQAPHQQFAAYRRAEITIVEAIRSTNPQLCARYVMQGSLAVDEGQPFPKDQAIEFQRLSWEAEASGRDTPAHRVIAKPGPADVRALLAGMTANGLSQQQLHSFSATGAMQLATPDDQCRIGLAFLHAVNDLPGDHGDSVYAFIAQQKPK